MENYWNKVSHLEILITYTVGWSSIATCQMIMLFKFCFSSVHNFITNMTNNGNNVLNLVFFNATAPFFP